MSLFFRFGRPSNPPAQSIADGRQPPIPQPDQVPRAHPSIRYDALTSGVKSVTAANHSMPLVCLSADSFLVIASNLALSETVVAKLPIVGGTAVGNGRVLCFSQLSYISDSRIISTACTQQFIGNSFQWLSGSARNFAPILAFGFNSGLTDQIQQTLNGFGICVEITDAARKLSSFSVAVIPSAIDLRVEARLDALANFVTTRGGGLGVFFSGEMMSIELPVNRLLRNFGLSFAETFLLNEGSELEEPIEVSPTYDGISELHMTSLFERFIAALDQAEVDEKALEASVTPLRFYRTACDGTYADLLLGVSTAALDSLVRTNYRIDDRLFFSVQQTLVAELFPCIFYTIPPDHLPVIPDHEVFPGRTGHATLSDFAIPLEFDVGVSVSTGLWLPAGVVGTIECESCFLQVQIGSHAQPLLAMPGQWRRWPEL
jgi:hypothetical protein